MVNRQQYHRVFRNKLKLGLQIFKPQVRLAWGHVPMKPNTSELLCMHCKVESKLLPFDVCLFTHLPCLFSYISWFFTEYSLFSYHLIKRSLAVILLEAVYFQKADHVEKKGLFLVILAISLWGKVHFRCVGTAEWVTGGDRGGVALFYVSATEGSANFLLQ